MNKFNYASDWSYYFDKLLQSQKRLVQYPQSKRHQKRVAKLKEELSGI